MNLEFFKYNSNGNDFIIIDDRSSSIKAHKKNIQKLCVREFSIGANGLIFLQNSQKADFKMKIFNSDGIEANMCGNGLLCLVKFISDFIIKKDSYLIETKSDVYHTFIDKKNVSFLSKFPKFLKENYLLNLQTTKHKMQIINSGVFHGVMFLNDVDNINVYKEGKKIRFYKDFSPTGINVNFCEVISDNEIKVRTYEKGVENETFCCSTGAIAVAWAYYNLKNLKQELKLHFKGGKINIVYEKKGLKLSSRPVFAFRGFSKSFDKNSN